MRTRLPRLLDAELREVTRLLPSSLSASIPESGYATATMVLPEDAPVKMRDFVEIYRNDESLGVYRVANIGHVYEDGIEVSLVHGLKTLEDNILPGQGQLSADVKTALTTLLSAQKIQRWTLGTVEAGTIAEAIEYDNANIWDGIQTIIGMLPDYHIITDQSVTPWVLHVLKKPEDVGCEGRLSRNIASLRITYDDTELCTALYLDGSDRYWHADTYDTWGEVARNFSTGSDLGDDATDEEIEAYIEKTVAEYFDKHKNPAVSIEIDGHDLSGVTGESMDAFKTGYMCRLALPDYETTVIERVVNVEYADLLHDPDHPLLQLSNRTQDATARVAGLMVSVQKIEKSVEKTVTDLDGTVAALRAFYDEFVYEKEEWKHTISEVSIELDAVNTSLALKAERSEVTALDVRLSSAEISLDGLNAEIELKVSLNGVISAINLSTEEARIQAAKIVLDGYVTTSKLSAEVASLKETYSTEMRTATLRATNIVLNGSTVTVLDGLPYVSSVTLPTVSGKYITYMDDTMDVVQQYVLTGFSQGSVSSKTKNFLAIS